MLDSDSSGIVDLTNLLGAKIDLSNLLKSQGNGKTSLIPH
jgi:hypothetical protein